MLLRTLLHRQKVYLQSSQCFPHSFCKTPGITYLKPKSFPCAPGFLEQHDQFCSSIQIRGIKMKAQSNNRTAINEVTRCSHRTAAGRQCRQLSADSRSGLCVHHRDLQKQKEMDDLSAELLQKCQNFQTGQGINFALSNIYRLLATNRISARRASVLAYINSLLLRTFPAIDYDWKNGYKDPTIPKPVVVQPAATQSSPTESAPAHDVAVQPSASSTNPSPQAANVIPFAAPPTNECVAVDSDSASTPTPVWSASIEPDLTKKPS